jgi:hypothetical protein
MCGASLRFVTSGQHTGGGGRYCYVSPGYPVVRADCFIDCAGREEVMDRVGRGRGKQRDYLRHWSADVAVWIYSCEFVLYWGVRSEYSSVDAGKREAGAAG